MKFIELMANKETDVSNLLRKILVRLDKIVIMVEGNFCDGRYVAYIKIEDYNLIWYLNAENYEKLLKFIELNSLQIA